MNLTIYTESFAQSLAFISFPESSTLDLVKLSKS